MALSAEYPSPIEVDWRAEVNVIPEDMGIVADNFFQYFFDGFVITPDRRKNALNLSDAIRSFKREAGDPQIQDLSLKDLDKRSIEKIEYHKQRFIKTKGMLDHRLEIKKWNAIRDSVQIIMCYSAQQSK